MKRAGSFRLRSTAKSVIPSKPLWREARNHIHAFTFLFLLHLPFIPASLYSQDSLPPSPSLAAGLYLEPYFAYQTLPYRHSGLWYSHHRSNEVTLNMGLVYLRAESQRARGNLGLMAGTYAQANLASEPVALRMIYSANVGLKLARRRNLWLDMGILPSHIGMESAVGMDNLVLTRHILSDNSPYYEAGAKLTHISQNGKWELAGLMLNGWQTIRRQPGSMLPSFGTQITWRPKDHLVLNSSTFVGSNDPDRIRRMRYYHDFYVTYAKGPWSMGATFDIGVQQSAHGSDTLQPFHGAAVVVRRELRSGVKAVARGEYYSDPHSVIFDAGSGSFSAFGGSLGADWQPDPIALLRLEARYLHSTEPLFGRGPNPLQEQWRFTASICLKIERDLGRGTEFAF
jgi:hypothetical protein